EDGADFRGALFEGLEVVLAMIEDNPGKSVINTIVDVVARFAFAPRFADDFCDGRGGGRNNETPRFSEDLNIRGKEAIDFRIDLPGESPNRFDVRIVSRRKAAPDINNLDLMAAFPGLLHNGGGKIEGLDEVFEVGALAAHVKANPFDDQPDAKRLLHQIHRLTGIASELRGQLDHRA